MSADEARFTVGLMYDVTRVLEEHGYRLPVDEAQSGRALGRTMSVLFELVHAYEGTEAGR